MGIVRGASITFAVLIVVVAFLSGPIVSAVDLTPATEQSPAPGSGVVSLDVVSVEEREVTLRKGKYGSGVYYLEGPDVTLNIQRVRGNPILVYKIRLPGVGYTTSSLTIIDPSMVGPARVSFPRDEFTPDQVTKSSYKAELLLLVRSDQDTRVLFRKNVSVGVEEA